MDVTKVDEADFVGGIRDEGMHFDGKPENTG